MPKLTKQQIIILSVMVVAVLYAAYDFFIAPRTKSAVIDIGEKSMELEAFINNITASMPKGSLSAADAYIVNRAEAQWTKDPFYDRKLFREWVKLKEPARAGGDGKSQKMSFIYSGYLKINNKTVAIVNGIEYESGDPLEIEGYVLKNIYQGKVVIINKKSRAKFDVPLQE
jgi:hypothetical protein